MHVYPRQADQLNRPHWRLLRLEHLLLCTRLQLGLALPAARRRSSKSYMRKAMITCARRRVAFPPAPCQRCDVGVQVRHKLHATCHGPNFRRRSPPATLAGNNQAGSHPTRVRNLGCIALSRRCFPAPQWAVPGDGSSLRTSCTVAGRAGSTQGTLQDPITAGGL